MLLVSSIAAAVLFKTGNVIKASAVLFMPLALVCWWLGVSGLLIAYSIGLPCLIGFTHFLRTRRNLIRSA
jgi:glycerol-3-phosphate acyltransferase PlsY